jgi:hypothetical protein
MTALELSDGIRGGTFILMRTSVQVQFFFKPFSELIKTIKVKVTT